MRVPAANDAAAALLHVNAVQHLAARETFACSLLIDGYAPLVAQPKLIVRRLASLGYSRRATYFRLQLTKLIERRLHIMGHGIAEISCRSKYSSNDVWLYSYKTSLR